MNGLSLLWVKLSNSRTKKNTTWKHEQQKLKMQRIHKTEKESIKQILSYSLLFFFFFIIIVFFVFSPVNILMYNRTAKA